MCVLTVLVHKGAVCAAVAEARLQNNGTDLLLCANARISAPPPGMHTHITSALKECRTIYHHILGGRRQLGQNKRLDLPLHAGMCIRIFKQSSYLSCDQVLDADTATVVGPTVTASSEALQFSIIKMHSHRINVVILERRNASVVINDELLVRNFWFIYNDVISYNVIFF